MSHEQLSLEYANCFQDRIGAEHGLDESAFKQAHKQLQGITNDLNNTRGSGWERWRDLPFDPMRREHVDAIRAIVYDKKSMADNLIVLGIGGSALGNIALQSALNPKTYNLMPRDAREQLGGGPRLFVLDNVDPNLIAQTFAEVRRTHPTLENTIVNVVSKSGETAETAAAFIVARSMLKESLGDKHREHIVAVTDPEKGTMRSICDDEGYATLPVPEGVGGRFSVLSPVGLFSAAMCGIDIDALLDGAAAMDERCSNTSIKENPAAILAWLLITFTQEKKKPNHVLMPYCNALYDLADWYRQLWAESLGKKEDLDGNTVYAGATPIKALGTTDQHSQVQLYREGPNDKVIGFVSVTDFEHDIRIPDDLDVDALKYLQGASMANLLHSEKLATEYALVESQRPNFTITFPKLNAYHVGEFIQLWEITTAYAGRLLNIDAYNQPAVETGKVATFGLMGRDGYGEWKEKVEGMLGGSAFIA